MGHAFHIFDRFGDVQTAARITNEWEAVNQQVHVIEAYHCYALQRLQQVAQLQRALAVIDMRWHNVESKVKDEMPEDKWVMLLLQLLLVADLVLLYRWTWTREDEGQTNLFASPSARVLVFHLLILAKLPSSVLKSEAASYVEKLQGV
jgi:hypothetical protein